MENLKCYHFFNKDAWDPTKPYPSKEDMVSYLTKHFRYWTMKCCNLTTSFANYVKIHAIGLAEEGVDDSAAIDFLCSESSEYEFEVQTLLNDFTREHPTIEACFNGRSGGYIVMYQRKRDDNGKYRTRPGIGYSECNNLDALQQYLNEADEYEIKELFTDVKAFDSLCDDIRAAFIHYVRTSKTRDIIVLEPTPCTISFCPDANDCEDEGLDRILNETVPDYKIYAHLDPISRDYVACVPQLDINNITGVSLELATMRAELAILKYLDEHPDTPAPMDI